MMVGVYSQWELPENAAIFSPLEAANYVSNIRSFKGPRVILTSGGFDPIHPGHISCLQDSRKRVAEQRPFERIECLFAKLIVVVNGPHFLERKKGRAFMPLKVRSQIVSAINGVDIVVPFNPTDPCDMSVSEALEIIKPDFFTKGGDRDENNIPELDVCTKYNIEIISGCGDDKHWSSSGFLKAYKKWLNDKQVSV